MIPWSLPLAWAYGTVGALRRGAYRRGYLPVGRAQVPVISVGAILSGGSGKTPVAGWLAGLLDAEHVRVGLIHSGYRGTEAHHIHRVDPAWRWEPGAARRFGDEALLLAAWQPRALVFCGRDKLCAARQAAEAGAQVVVVDDGYQHRRLHRDLDLLLDDPWPELPFPAGRARERAGASSDADLRWEHSRGGEAPSLGTPLASRCVPASVHALDGSRLGSAADLSGRRVFLLAGIARPEAFRRVVEALGARLVGHAWARDHALFSARELRRAARSRADVLLCTEKDAVRALSGPGRGGAGAQARSVTRDLAFLSCGLELTRGLELLRARLRPLLSGRG